MDLPTGSSSNSSRRNPIAYVESGAVYTVPAAPARRANDSYLDLVPKWRIFSMPQEPTVSVLNLVAQGQCERLPSKKSEVERGEAGLRVENGKKRGFSRI